MERLVLCAFVINSLTMNPVQFIRLGIGDEGVQLPLYRLPFAGGHDGAATPGGFFTSKTGEFGVVIDARLGVEEAQRLVADELQRAAPIIASLLAARDSKKAAARESVPQSPPSS